LISSLGFIYNPYSYWNVSIFERLYFLADDILVSNNFLKNKFGGTIIWHARDSETFNPIKYDKASIRDQYGIAKNKKIVMFCGSIRPHKGLDDLVRAVKLINDDNILLVLVGIENNQECDNLSRLANDLLGTKFMGIGLQPFNKIPEILTLADVIVIPQKKTFPSVGQMPAKVFDAMAMAKPIIGTTMSGLPNILEGCGLIVPPSNPKEMALAIEYLLHNPNYAAEIGSKARKKFNENYSWDVMGEVLLKIFNKYETY